jgi:hypothetical protein
MRLSRMTSIRQQAQAGGDGTAAKRVDFSNNAVGSYAQLSRVNAHEELTCLLQYGLSQRRQARSEGAFRQTIKEFLRLVESALCQFARPR